MTNGLQSVNVFMETFGNPTGSTLGFYGAAMTVGGFVACFIAGPLSDRVGRRLVCSLGAVLVIGAALLQTFSTNFGMFVGGKMILGLGVNFQLLTAPVLVTELAHPMNRVFITSFYNTNIFIGLIIGGWITFICIPSYQSIMVWFCPESPRWLVTKGKVVEARKILMHYHSTQNGLDDGMVQTELQAIIAGVQADQTQIKVNKAGLKSIIMSKGNRHRLWLCFWTAVGSQCGGGTFIASYLPQILNQIGMTSQHQKTLINAIMSICNWVTAIIGIFIIPHVKRRSFFLFSTITMTVAFTVWTALAASYTKDPRKGYGLGVLAMMFLFNACQTVCWIPLVITYPLETVTTKQRSIFFSSTMFSMNIASFIAQYINPVGLEALSWRWYIIQIVFNTCLIVLIYFTWVETHGLTLEEIAMVFDGKESFEGARVAAEETWRKL
ncbi:MFS hexose [Fusarium albosuccineum]|uniref:MFS hexose n=1 Tax=Fusarium albosuccineum TaxID=1237068 RepID=A0A8H4LD69_9HYPO|nr:MFS hexose [Fusarium albosuccineum]